MVEGFFSESGVVSYDLYGPAIVLANRYEAMRKNIPTVQSKSNLIAVQDAIYMSLSEKNRKGFQQFTLAKGKTIRDDPGANRLHYLFVDGDDNLIEGQQISA